MGSFRSSPDKEKHTLMKDGKDLSYASSHMCGWRIYMEDADIAVSPMANPKHSLFAIFDGHGGAEVSTYASKHFQKALESNKNYKSQNFKEALIQTYMEIDEQLLTPNGKNEIVAIQKQMKDKDNGPKYDQQSHAGCTANVVLITPETIYCANAGDSRAVACVAGQTVELSRDHKPEDKEQIERINKAGGRIEFGRVNGGLNLTRALGDFQYKKQTNLPPEEQMITAKPDVLSIKNQNVDFIIMGCDGIWEIKQNSEMVAWVKQRIDKKDERQIVEELLESLISKDNTNQYGMDNMSAILIKFNKKK